MGAHPERFWRGVGLPASSGGHGFSRAKKTRRWRFFLLRLPRLFFFGAFHPRKVFVFDQTKFARSEPHYFAALPTVTS